MASKRKPVKVREPARKRPRGMVQLHVVPKLRGLGGWTLRVEGRPVGTVRKQEDAEQLAIFLGRLLAPSSLRFHGRDGRIIEERTYSRHDDPVGTPG